MPAVPIPLATGSNPGRDFRDGSGRLVNCYVEPRGKEGRWDAPVYPIDGLTEIGQLPTVVAGQDEDGDILQEDGESLLLTEDEADHLVLEGDPFLGIQASPDLGVQVMIPDRGYLWIITGRGVYKMDVGGDVTFIGNIAQSKTITADINRTNQIGIVSDGRYYVCDTILETVVDYTDQLLITGVNSVVHYNGYMVVTNTNDVFQISNVDDASLWDDVDNSTTIFRGDILRRAMVRGGDLLLFGDESLEFWQDVGATNGFTFNRVAAIEVGIGPPLSAANLDEAVLFVDQDFAVRIVEGYRTQTISTPYVGRKIRQADDPYSIRAYSYERDGHMFYSISCSNFTLTYNMATGMWHEEKSYGLDRRIIGALGKLDGKYYAGNYAEGIVYRMDADTYDEGASKPIVMEIITPPVHMFPDKVRVRSLFIDAAFRPGVVDVNADESDPKVIVAVSEDDGENFAILEQLSVGDVSQKYAELRVQGVGTSEQNGFVFRISSSTPVLKGILGMSADVSKVRA